MLEIKGLNQFYGESHTLWDLDISIPEGQCTVLMGGRNGGVGGKTTLLQCVMGLLPVKSGEIVLKGKNICGLTAESRPHHGVGYVPQGAPDLSVVERRGKSADWTAYSC